MTTMFFNLYVLSMASKRLVLRLFHKLQRVIAVRTWYCTCNLSNKANNIVVKLLGAPGWCHWAQTDSNIDYTSSKQKTYAFAFQQRSQETRVFTRNSMIKEISAHRQALVCQTPNKATNSWWNIYVPNTLPPSTTMGRAVCLDKIRTSTVGRFDNIGAIKCRLPNA